MKLLKQEMKKVCGTQRLTMIVSAYAAQDQYIFLHRKLAIILDRLTTQAENETQEYIKSLGRIFQKSTENAEVVTAHTQMLETMTLQLKNIVGSSLSDSTRVRLSAHYFTSQ